MYVAGFLLLYNLRLHLSNAKTSMASALTLAAPESQQGVLCEQTQLREVRQQLHYNS